MVYGYACHSLYNVHVYMYVHSLFVSDHEDPYKLDTKTDRKIGDTGTGGVYNMYIGVFKM